MKTKLRNYQKQAVKEIQHFKGRALLADEMGLGKTLEALKWLQINPNKRPVIVVCPAFLKWVWKTEARQHLKMHTKILDGQTPATKPDHKYQIFIINYEVLQYWIDWLKQLMPQVLILDECHYIKNLRAKRTKAIYKLKHIPHIVALGGTPLLSRPAELWPTIHLIRPLTFNSLWKFRWRYCKPTHTPWGWQYKGAANLKELHYKLTKTMMIRRRKKDVLGELPEKIRQTIPFDIELNEYKKAEYQFIQWLTERGKTKAQKAKRAEQLVQMGYLRRLAAQAKLPTVIHWIDNFLDETDSKLVLYCIHRAVIKRLTDVYHGECVGIDGNSTSKQRQWAVNTFQNSKSARLFIGQIKAAGLGITLTAASSLAFIEMAWTPSIHAQAEDRIHRIGQKTAAMIYYLIAKDTIEEKLCKIIQKKQAIVSATLNGKHKVDKLDIFTELQKALLLRQTK